MRIDLRGALGTFADVLGIIVGLWPILLPLGVAGVALVKTLPAMPVSSIIATVAIVVIVVTLIMAVQRVLYLKRISGPDLNPHWRVEKTISHARVYSQTDIDYEYEVVVVAKRNGESVLRYSTTWTGSGEFTVESLTPGVHAADDEVVAGISEVFHFSFSKPCKRGERRTLRYRIRTRGTNKAQKPFFSRSISHRNGPKRENELLITFAPGVNVENLWEEHYVVPGPPWPSKQKLLGPLGVDRTARIRFNRRVGHRYGFRWSYGD